MEEKDLYTELEKIKAELEELKQKIGGPEEKSIKALPAEILSKIADVGKEVVKQAAEIAEKALTIVKYSVEGAAEGVKKALKEEKEDKK
ncbi:MAG: hypothetical protein ACK4GE_02415 [Caldimicrobium sp.]